MEKIKKVFSFKKVILIVLAISFLYTNSSYSIEISGKSILRVPLFLGHSSNGKDRLNEASDAVNKKRILYLLAYDNFTPWSERRLYQYRNLRLGVTDYNGRIRLGRKNGEDIRIYVSGTTKSVVEVTLQEIQLDKDNNPIFIFKSDKEKGRKYQLGVMDEKTESWSLEKVIKNAGVNGLRSPSLRAKLAVFRDETIADYLASLSNDHLILEAKYSMPYYDAANPGWTMFNKIIRVLRTRKDIKISIYPGPEFKNKYDIDIDKIWGMNNSDSINKFWRTDIENAFVRYMLQNIYQHVKPGIALVVEQGIMTKKGTLYKAISFSDNGLRPIDEKTSEKIPAADFLKLEGKNSVIIEGPGEKPKSVAQKIPGEDDMLSRKIIWRNSRKKPYGFTVTGYFLRESAYREDIKNDIIERAEEAVTFYQSKQLSPSIKARTDL